MSASSATVPWPGGLSSSQVCLDVVLILATRLLGMPVLNPSNNVLQFLPLHTVAVDAETGSE